MTIPKYENMPVDTTIQLDLRTIAGKTAVITGGSGGLGLCFGQSLAKAGAFVVIGDLKPPAEVTENVFFSKCDVTSWEDQVELFKVAKAKSPRGGIDVVIANAGVYGPDIFDGINDDEPQKPQTKMLDVNLIGVIYTSKLAGCIMGYIDTQGSSIYSAAKHAVRGIMTCLRRKSLVRVNCIAPWFVATNILPENFLKSAGSQFRDMSLDFAMTDDAVSAVFKLATDTSINGRTLGIVPRQLAPSGYMDFGVDDFEEGTPLHKLQTAASSLVYGVFGNSSAT